jgi:hypothetical protein
MDRTSQQSGRRIAQSSVGMSGWTQPRAGRSPWSADRPLVTPGPANSERSLADAVPLGRTIDENPREGEVAHNIHIKANQGIQFAVSSNRFILQLRSPNCQGEE